MRLAPKRFWPILAGLMLIAATLAAQTEGNLIVNTVPQGSPVVIEGEEITLSGITPVKFNTVLSGAFKLVVERKGFEKHEQTIYVSESRPFKVDIRLNPKTRTKAFFRSMIIPGWGQNYYGSKSKTYGFLLGTVAASAGFLIARDDYNDKYDTYLQKKAARNNADTWSEIEKLDQELYDAQKSANDAEDIKNIMMCATIGIYALNLLDAILFFPDFNTFSEYEALTLKPEYNGQKVSISLALNF